MALAGHRSTLIRIAGSLLAGWLLAIALLSPVSWANSGVSQGFTTTEKNLVPGTVMGLKSNTDNIVVPAVSSQHYQLLGIVANQPLIALNDGSSQVQIVVSGPSEALVSNINGPIKAGDRITASPISGVGMKATDSGQIIGTAQTGLSGNTTKQTITDKNGQKHTISVGTITLQISVGYYSGQENQGKLASALPPGLLSFASNIAGQDVSALRVLISLLALIIGFIIVANMLQASIRGSMTAMGRNPLAKQAIRRELIDICLTALGVLILTIVIVYLIIKL